MSAAMTPQEEQALADMRARVFSAIHTAVGRHDGGMSLTAPEWIGVSGAAVAWLARAFVGAYQRELLMQASPQVMSGLVAAVHQAMEDFRRELQAAAKDN